MYMRVRLVADYKKLHYLNAIHAFLFLSLGDLNN